MRIAVITGSRADRGPLEMVFQALEKGRRDNVRWIDITYVTQNSDIVSAAAEASIQVGGRLRSSFTSELGGIATDLVIVHGDRYEILGAALGANLAGIPIAHLAGGDITEGSKDNDYRYAISALAHIHFPNCPESANRLIQIGIELERVHMVGDPAVDRILQTPLMGRDETFDAVGLALPRRALLVSFHPETLSDSPDAIGALLGALRDLAADVGVVLIGPNADPGWSCIDTAWKLLASARPNTVYCSNLPGDVFLSLLEHCDVMVGNSSAGFYEAPCFGLPVINIGDRQKGRQSANCILQADNQQDIFYLIDRVLEVGKPDYEIINPYGDGHAAERIANIIGGIKDPKSLLRKRFQSMERHPQEATMGDVPQ